LQDICLEKIIEHFKTSDVSLYNILQKINELNKLNLSESMSILNNNSYNNSRIIYLKEKLNKTSDEASYMLDAAEKLENELHVLKNEKMSDEITIKELLTTNELLRLEIKSLKDHGNKNSN